MHLWARLNGGFHHNLIVEITNPEHDISRVGEFMVGDGKLAEMYRVKSFSPKEKVRSEFVDVDTNRRRTVRALQAMFVGKPS